MHPLNDNPVLPLLVAHPADFETVIDLLRGNRADVDRVCQNTLDSGEVPDKPPSLRVLPFKLGNVVAQALLTVPPCGAGDFFIFQPAADAVGAAAVLRPLKNPADDPGGILVNEKMVFVLRVFAVAERGQTAGKLAGLGFCQVGRMDFLAHIPAIHLVQQRAKRGYLILNLAVYGIVQSDIPYLLPWEKIFQQLAHLQIVPAQPGEVFRQDHIEHFPLNRRQHLLKVGALHVQAGVPVILENPCHAPALFLTVPAQQFPLVLDACAGAAQIIVLGQAAIDSCSHLLGIGFSIHSVSPHF